MQRVAMIRDMAFPLLATIMALPPSPRFTFHDRLEREIAEIVRASGSKEIILSYRLLPDPAATICCEGFEPHQVELPHSAAPYKTWKEWFRSFLEQQVRVVAAEMKISAYVVTNKNRVALIERGG